MARSSVFAWVWLPGATEPVVAGRLDDRGAVITFTYGASYLNRQDAIPLYEPELPLRRGEISPRSGRLAGCIADSGPDAWGRRVIEHRRTGRPDDLDELGYLLASGSERIGALDFQTTPDTYEPRRGDRASLVDLADAARRLEAGERLPEQLDLALLHGSSVGGARPKALLDGDDGRRHIAKFASSTDSYPVVQAEFVAMDLARRAGVQVAPVEITFVDRSPVLLVERFDRTSEGGRRLLVSALTILELHDADGIAGRYATYADLADQIRSRFARPTETLRELFGRISFNVLVSNHDDHARNHAALWDGQQLELTPAYDICPQLRTGGEVAQAMAYGPAGERLSQVSTLVECAAVYHLDRADAQAIVDQQIDVIRSDWDDVCDRAQLTSADRERMWSRQFLNPFSVDA